VNFSDEDAVRDEIGAELGIQSTQLRIDRITSIASLYQVAMKRGRRSWIVARDEDDARKVALSLYQASVKDLPTDIFWKLYLESGKAPAHARFGGTMGRPWVQDISELAKRMLQKHGLKGAFSTEPRETPSGLVYWAAKKTAFLQRELGSA
jgi:hypothetical protein